MIRYAAERTRVYAQHGLRNASASAVRPRMRRLQFLPAGRMASHRREACNVARLCVPATIFFTRGNFSNRETTNKQPYQTTNKQLGQVTKQLGQLTKQLGQVTKQLGQVTKQLGQVAKQLGQVFGCTKRLFDCCLA